MHVNLAQNVCVYFGYVVFNTELLIAIAMESPHRVPLAELHPLHACCCVTSDFREN